VHEPRTMESQMEEYELDVEDHMYKVKEKSVADELPGGGVADDDEVSGRGRAHCQEGKSMEDLGNYNPGSRPGTIPARRGRR
jgi:hypothetical protein